MSVAAEVRLPRDLEPEFPAQCCRCMRQDPEHLVRFSASRFSWAEIFFVWIWLFRKPKKCRIPVCHACRPRVRTLRYLTWALLLLLSAGAVILVRPWLASYGASRGWQNLGAFAAMFICAMPFALLVAFRPPSFDLSVGKLDVVYEFANHDYARLFRAANTDEPVGYWDDDDE